MNDTIRIFGVRQIGFFVEKLKISNDGFTYKNRRYGWAAVVTVKRSDDIINVLSRYPSSTILLEDGKIIRLPVILEEKNKLNSESSYRNCLDIIESKIHNNNRKFEKYLCPCSYIMFYRFAIIVGLIQISLLICLDLLPGMPGRK